MHQRNIESSLTPNDDESGFIYWRTRNIRSDFRLCLHCTQQTHAMFLCRSDCFVRDGRSIAANN